MKPVNSVAEGDGGILGSRPLFLSGSQALSLARHNGGGSSPGRTIQHELEFLSNLLNSRSDRRPRLNHILALVMTLCTIWKDKVR